MFSSTRNPIESVPLIFAMKVANSPEILILFTATPGYKMCTRPFSVNTSSSFFALNSSLLMAPISSRSLRSFRFLDTIRVIHCIWSVTFSWLSCFSLHFHPYLIFKLTGDSVLGVTPAAGRLFSSNITVLMFSI